MTERRKWPGRFPSSVVWGFTFFVFLFFSSEDRLFKNWKEEIREFVTWDGEIRDWARANMSPGAVILIDIPEWKDWGAPFANRSLGNIRRFIYHKAFPRSPAILKRLSSLVPTPRLVRLDSRKRFQEDARAALRELPFGSGLGPEGLKALARSGDIGFYLCSFTDYRLKSRAMDAAGFRLIHSNPRLMLWSVKE